MSRPVDPTWVAFYLKPILDQMQNLEEMGGPNSNTYIAIMEALTQEVSKRAATCRANMPKLLSESSRQKVVDFLSSKKVDCMFGDGAEDDYVMSGTTIIGLEEMTDVELVEDLKFYVDDDDELLLKVSAEIEVELLLGGDRE